MLPHGREDVVTDRKSLAEPRTRPTPATPGGEEEEYHCGGRHDEAFDEETRILTCDIGRFLRRGVRPKPSRASWRCPPDIGFAILEGHGIPAPSTRRPRGGVELSAREPRRKMRFRRTHGSVNQGTSPQGDERHPPDSSGLGFCPGPSTSGARLVPRAGVMAARTGPVFAALPRPRPILPHAEPAGLLAATRTSTTEAHRRLRQP